VINATIARMVLVIFMGLLICLRRLRKSAGSAGNIQAKLQKSHLRKMSLVFSLFFYRSIIKSAGFEFEILKILNRIVSRDNPITDTPITI